MIIGFFFCFWQEESEPNGCKTHQSLDQQSPIPRPEPATTGKVERRRILDGILNDYYRVPDKTAVYLA
jgi:hypothetical protein